MERKYIPPFSIQWSSFLTIYHTSKSSTFQSPLCPS